MVASAFVGALPTPAGIPNLALGNVSSASVSRNDPFAPASQRGPAAQRDETAEMRKLRNRAENAEAALRNSNRKTATHADGGRHTDGNNGAGKKKAKGAGHDRLPAGLQGKRGKTDNTEPLCFNFNLPKGCTGARPGERCSRGWHLCAQPSCSQAHSLQGNH